jgi:hypothetical protein
MRQFGVTGGVARHIGWHLCRAWLMGFLVAALPGVAGASAIPEPGYRYVAVLDGECERLILADRDRTAGCRDQLVNVDFGDGRVAFVFTSPTVVTAFLGRASAQRDLRNYRLDVDQISTATTNAAGDPADFVESAAGHCVMTGDPTRERARFECTAERRSGPAAATFLSAGVPTVYAGGPGDTSRTAALTPAP